MAGYEVHVAWAGGTAFSGGSDNVSAAVKHIDITRGLDPSFASMTAGEATIRLHDPDGVFNPANGTTPYNVKPLRPVRVRYQPYGGGTAYGLFYGFLRRATHSPRGGDSPGETVLECEDALLLVDGFNPQVAGGAAYDVSDLVTDIFAAGAGTVLDVLGKSIGTPGVMIDGVGDPLDDGSTGYLLTGAESALSVIGRALQVDRGEFYANASGTVVYNTADARWTRAVSGTVTSPHGVTPMIDFDRIQNTAHVSKDGTEFMDAADSTSIGLYGVREGQSITNDFLMGTAQADSLAEWLVVSGGSPDVPIDRVSFSYVAGSAAESGVFQYAYKFDLGTRVNVVDTVAKIGTVDAFIDRITHTIEPGGVHAWEWGLTPRTTLGTAGTAWSPFIIGGAGTGSALNSGHKVGY